MSESGDCEQLLIDYFHECPRLEPALVAMALYAVISVVVAAITAWTQAWFMMTVALTGVLETVGFAFRVRMIQNPTYGDFVAMQCFLIISPVLLAIVEYICVGKLLQLSEAGRTSRFTKWIAWVFTASDIICLALQGAGGGTITSEDQNTQKIGRILMLTGLFLQLAFFTLFVIVALYVQHSPKFELQGNRRMLPLFVCLYSTVALMYVRNVYRVAEFVQGWDGYIASHEEYFYGFDFAPLYLCFLFFSFLHYGFFLRQDNRYHPDKQTPVQPRHYIITSPGGPVGPGMEPDARALTPMPWPLQDVQSAYPTQGQGWQPQYHPPQQWQGEQAGRQQLQQQPQLAHHGGQAHQGWHGQQVWPEHYAQVWQVKNPSFQWSGAQQYGYGH